MKENSSRPQSKRPSNAGPAAVAAKRQATGPVEGDLQRPMYDLKLPCESQLRGALEEHIAWDRVSPEATAELERIAHCDGDGASLAAALARSALDTLTTSHHLCQATVAFTRCVSAPIPHPGASMQHHKSLQRSCAHVSSRLVVSLPAPNTENY